MSACLIVRAQVVDATVKGAFDRWYHEEHLRDCIRDFGGHRAWRGWSEVDPSVHYAVYEFDDVAQARAVLGSDALKRRAAEFDGKWGDKVVRNRDLVEVFQTIAS